MTASRFALMAVAAFSIAGCMGRARKSEPLAGPTVLDRVAEQRGQLVFMEHCNQCHPGGAAGLGPAINDLKLPSQMIELKVRTGHPVMPAFPSKVIGPHELDDLVQYLMAMRAKDDGRD
jgi:mono/diheme cytochrome c family protein